MAEVLKHGTLSVGFIGLAETLMALTGKHHGESEESQKLGLEIIGLHAQAHGRRSPRSTGLNFTLLATPAEGLSGRFVRIDQKKLRRNPRRHRPGVLHQLLPRPGVLSHHRL